MQKFQTFIISEVYPIDGAVCVPNLCTAGFIYAASVASVDCRILAADGGEDVVRIFFNPTDHQAGKSHFSIQTKFLVTQVHKGFTVDYSSVHDAHIESILSR